MVAGSGLPVGLLHIFGGDCGGQFGVRDNAFGGGCRGEDRLMLAVVGSDPWSMVVSSVTLFIAESVLLILFLVGL